MRLFGRDTSCDSQKQTEKLKFKTGIGEYVVLAWKNARCRSGGTAPAIIIKYI